MDGVHLRGCTGTRSSPTPFPAYVAPPAAADTARTSAARWRRGGDALYVRYQAAPVVAQMLPADGGRHITADCAASTANQNEVLSSPQLRAGVGLERPHRDQRFHARSRY